MSLVYITHRTLVTSCVPIRYPVPEIVMAELGRNLHIASRLSVKGLYNTFNWRGKYRTKLMKVVGFHIQACCFK